MSHIILKLQQDVTYPIDENNDTIDIGEGPVRLVGFQDYADVQRVNLFVSDWRKDPESAIGKFPVFSRGAAGMYVVTLSVVYVEEVK